jgi:MYXO-CTERM domain-containing protein
MLLFSLPAAAQEVSIHESLASTSSATTVYGGTFTGAGWRVDDSNSRLYWDFGTQVESGDVSVTVDDISWDNLCCANNHIIELFSWGGHSDDNRAINLRLYGEGDGDPYDEWGDIKLVVWDRATDLFAEQRYYGLDWDGLPHTWRITWDLTDCVLYRDGVELIRLDVTGIDLRMGTLWLPLNVWGGDYSAPIGTLYSDLSLDGWEPGAELDTGVPDDGDATTVPVEDDVTAASWAPDVVFTDEDDLIVELDGSSPVAVSYLLFDTSAFSGTVTSATLELQARSTDEATGDGGTVYAVSDTSWSEDSLTWSSRPALGAEIGTFPGVSPEDAVTIDVTTATTAGGKVAFALVSGGSDSAHFSSKEDRGGAAAPQLRIATTGGGGDGGGGGDDGGGDGGGGDEGLDTGGGGGGGPHAGGRGPGEIAAADPGCGCASGPGGGWLALGLAGLALARRR